MKYFFFILISITLILGSCVHKEPILKIGLVADPQYADKDKLHKRYYRESLWKLKEAIDTLNNHNVDFVQNLGDIIDSDWKSYHSIMPIYQTLDSNIENYHLLGNHDFAIDSLHYGKLLNTLSMPNYYYSYTRNGFRFIVLDATDYSYFSNLLHNYDTKQVDFYFNNTVGKANHHKWNSAIGEGQQAWLKQELDSSELLGQKVIIFSHMPVKPIGNPHNLWNGYEIIDIIEKSSSVIAFINGHNHEGEYVYENGIHYITINGMVDTKINSFGILEIFTDSLILRGYGNQRTLHLTYHKK